MESGDFIALPALGDSGCGAANDELNNSHGDSKEVDCPPTISEDKEDKQDGEILGHVSIAQCEDGECIPESNLEKELVDNDSDMEIEDINDLPALKSSGHSDMVDKSSVQQGSVVLSDTVTVALESNIVCSTVPESGQLAVRGVKRSRTTLEEQASVCVTYKSLTRASKHKLEELLQQWSEWHAKHVSSSQDPMQVLESGEETLFPALHVGTERTSRVSFWMDNESGKAQSKESVSLDGNYVPLYDRGYALGLTLDGGSSNQEGGLEIVDDASRCFNCGSYNHALKECPKPRDYAAVNSARKQRKFKKNQTANSRNSTRYYQNSPAGKYDGLRPGALDAETRKLLGLGELDPPPWLNRMQEIGYPPGYLDLDEDQPSGIIIHGGTETKVDQEDGEIIETDHPVAPEPLRKKSVEFPGVNAPIPENADGRLWALGPSFSDTPRNHSNSRSNHYSEPVSRGHHREQRWSRDLRDDGPPGVVHREQRWSREWRDDGPLGIDHREQRWTRELRDDGPPGVDPGFAPSSYPPRYGSYASAPPSGRSQAERSRRPTEFSFPYSPTRDSHSTKYDYLNDEFSSRSWDRVDRNRHHQRR